MATEAQKVITGRGKHGAQEMSASIARLVDTIAGMLLQLPAPQRLEVLRQVEAKIKPAASGKEILRKVTKTGGGSYIIALPASFAKYVGTYKVNIEENRLILEPSNNADARIRYYGSRLKLMLPKRLVEALGFPEYVRVRVEDGRIVVEPA
jgi:hypothetical protein